MLTYIPDIVRLSYLALCVSPFLNVAFPGRIHYNVQYKATEGSNN